MLIYVGINAQFNYQAILKDSDGNAITNNQVKIKFSLMYQSATTATPVFVEEHDITTPADGVVNLSVGGGTVVNGTFSDIRLVTECIYERRVRYRKWISGYGD